MMRRLGLTAQELDALGDVPWTVIVTAYHTCPERVQPRDIAHAVAYMAQVVGMTRGEAAEQFRKKSVQWCSTVLLFFELAPEVQVLCDANRPHNQRLTWADIRELSAVPQADQLRRANNVLRCRDDLGRCRAAPRPHHR